MGLSRKGIIFSLLAVGLSSLFLILFTQEYDVPLDAGTDSTNTQVLAFNAAVNEAFDYAKLSVTTATMYALEDLYKNVSEYGYLSDFNRSLLWCMHSGTYCTTTLDYVSLIDEFVVMNTDELAIPLGMRVNDVDFIGEGPFTLSFRVNVSVWITDEFARWNLTRSFVTHVSTQGSPDPAFLTINDRFGGNESRRVVESATVDYEMDFRRFIDYYYTGLYLPSSEGPCLSHRFMGLWDAHDSSCGIETIVNPNWQPKLSDESLPHYINLTMVDYQLLRNLSRPCRPFNGLLPRVSIRNVSLNLTLTTEDVFRFNLEDVMYWSDVLNATTARCCAGFEGRISDC